MSGFPWIAAVAFDIVALIGSPFCTYAHVSALFVWLPRLLLLGIVTAVLMGCCCSFAQPHC